MAPVIVGTTTTPQGSATATATTCPFPAFITGDILIAFQVGVSVTDPATPAGWTQLAHLRGNTGAGTDLYWTANPSTASNSFSIASGSVQITSIRGSSPSSPIDGVTPVFVPTGTGAGTPYAIPLITTNVPNCLVFGFNAIRSTLSTTANSTSVTLPNLLPMNNSPTSAGGFSSSGWVAAPTAGTVSGYTGRYVQAINATDGVATYALSIAPTLYSAMSSVGSLSTGSVLVPTYPSPTASPSPNASPGPTLTDGTVVTTNGVVTMSGTGTLTAVPMLTVVTASSMSGSADLAANGRGGASPNIAMTASSGLTATANTAVSTQSLSATAGLTAIGTTATTGAATLSAAATMTASVIAVTAATSVMSGSAFITVTATNSVLTGAALSASSNLAASSAVSTSAASFLSASSNFSATGVVLVVGSGMSAASSITVTATVIAVPVGLTATSALNVAYDPTFTFEVVAKASLYPRRWAATLGAMP